MAVLRCTGILPNPLPCGCIVGAILVLTSVEISYGMVTVIGFVVANVGVVMTATDANAFVCSFARVELVGCSVSRIVEMGVLRCGKILPNPRPLGVTTGRAAELIMVELSM